MDPVQNVKKEKGKKVFFFDLSQGKDNTFKMVQQKGKKIEGR